MEAFVLITRCRDIASLWTPFQLASRAVTCAEYFEFMKAGCYGQAQWWLSEGWDTVLREGWTAPLYWQGNGENMADWSVYTMRGVVPTSRVGGDARLSCELLRGRGLRALVRQETAD